MSSAVELAEKVLVIADTVARITPTKADDALIELGQDVVDALKLVPGVLPERTDEVAALRARVEATVAGLRDEADKLRG